MKSVIGWVALSAPFVALAVWMLWAKLSKSKDDFPMTGE